MSGVIIGYCVSCRIKREVQNGVKYTMANGQSAIKGNCKYCLTGINKILPSKPK